LLLCSFQLGGFLHGFIGSFLFALSLVGVGQRGFYARGSRPPSVPATARTRGWL
jgi:hypothetical protein